MSDPTCPHCGADLSGGLGTFCWDCKRYTDEKPEPKGGPGTSVPDLSEDEIQRRITDYLRQVGCDVVDTSQGYRPDGSTRITAGLSDLIVFGTGRLVFAEIKAAKGKQTEHQRRFERWCERAGAAYAVWRSVEDAVAWMEGGS